MTMLRTALSAAGLLLVAPAVAASPALAPRPAIRAGGCGSTMDASSHAGFFWISSIWR